MQSMNVTAANVEKIAALFPSCVTERLNSKGVLELAIDFDKLRMELGADVLDETEERYQFTWPDKREAIRLSNARTTMTLRPCREESVDFDNTENLYIEGDNLEVLKVLQQNYLGKVKMIYIDPPYNTGGDFIYKDKRVIRAEEYKNNSGQYDAEGNQLVKNTESNGRFHTDWLNFMYPRLKVARNLLKENGVMFISIDENEVDNLHKICNEIYGDYNFIGQFVWQNKKGGGNDSVHIAVEHEYVLVYAKHKNELSAFYEQYSEEYMKRYKEEDSIGKFFWDTFKRKSGKQYYPIECPDGTILQYDDDGNEISWLRSYNRFKKDVEEGEIRIIKINDKWSVQFKQRMPQGKKPRSIFTTDTVFSDKGTTSTGSTDVYEYFKKDVFSNPKPLELINFFIGFGACDDDIVIDFFSGSATTAEAVMLNNSKNLEHLKYILVQIQEKIDPSISSSTNAARIANNAISILDEIKRPHYLTEIAKERIRRAGKKIKEDYPNVDTGFRVLKIDESNMKDVYYTPGEIQEQDLWDSLSNIKEDRTPEDLLFQVIPECGVKYSEKIDVLEIAGKKVFSVMDNYLAACFDENVNEEVITAIAKTRPAYFVMRDSSLESDNVADNFMQIFKQYSPETTCKII